MKRLYIVVEGQTEEKFVNSVLAPYLSKSQQLHSVTPMPIHRGRGARGGMVSYEPLKKDVLRLDVLIPLGKRYGVRLPAMNKKYPYERLR